MISMLQPLKSSLNFIKQIMSAPKNDFRIVTKICVFTLCRNLLCSLPGNGIGGPRSSFGILIVRYEKVVKNGLVVPFENTIIGSETA